MMTAPLLRILVAAVIFLGFSGSVSAQSTSIDDCPPSQFTEWGMNGVVTPGDPNNVRAEPSTSAALVGRIQPGEPFNVIYRGIACAEGYLWREIETLTMTGWTVEIPAEGDEPFIVPYEPEPVEIGDLLEDGSIRVEESGVAFVVPAGLNATKVKVVPKVGFFGIGTMSAQPSSVVFTILNEAISVRLAIYPYAISDATYEYLANEELESLIAGKPPLLDYAAQNPMPQSPIGGAAAIFGGAGAYVPFGSGDGLRYVTYFAQDSVIFTPDMDFQYLYRGITADQAFLVAAEAYPISIPAGVIPSGTSRTSHLDPAYSAYLRQFEANLASQPANAFSPDLALIDALFASLTITDNEALIDSIP